MIRTDRDLATSDEAPRDGVLERSLGSAWDQLGPLSVGAVVSAAAIVGATALLRRALGSSRSVLGWAGAVALLPIGYWLLSDVEDEPAAAPRGISDPSRGEASEEEVPMENGDTGEADGG
jgi:hypothetical protein